MTTKLTTLLLLFCAFTVSGIAQESIVSSVSPSTGTPAPDETVTASVSINLTNTSSALGSFTASLEWDPDVLSYASNSGVSGGLSGFVNTNNVSSGRIEFNGTNASGVTGSITVMSVMFNVTGEHGQSSILDLAFSAMSAAGTFANLLPILGTNDNSITVFDPALPVELSSFTAQNSGEAVILKWTTESESNNFGFEIERGRERDVFQRIGFVPGHGTTTNPKQYQFTDSDLSSGVYFYRLKQVDTDGAFEHSNIIQITLSAPADFVLHQNYPNPFNPETKINYHVARNVEVRIIVYNLKGEEVKVLVEDFSKVGSFEVSWNGKDQKGQPVSSGNYLIKMQVGQFTQVKKAILLR